MSFQWLTGTALHPPPSLFAILPVVSGPVSPQYADHRQSVGQISRLHAAGKWQGDFAFPDFCASMPRRSLLLHLWSHFSCDWVHKEPAFKRHPEARHTAPSTKVGGCFVLYSPQSDFLATITPSEKGTQKKTYKLKNMHWMKSKFKTSIKGKFFINIFQREYSSSNPLHLNEIPSAEGRVCFPPISL